MIFLLIMVFTISLVYLSLAERVQRFVNLLIIQGILLFGIAYYQLKHIEVVSLIFILVETLVVKSIATPLFLYYIRKKNKLNRLDESHVPVFVSVLIISTAIIFGFVISHYLSSQYMQSIFFSVAISSVVTGVYFIISHRNVFTHLIGYLVIENGIFLLSLSVGAEMTMLVHNAIMLDIFISILALGIFINKLGDTFQNVDVDNLSQLKD